jgi:hypothetical protein
MFNTQSPSDDSSTDTASKNTFARLVFDLSSAENGPKGAFSAQNGLPDGQYVVNFAKNGIFEGLSAEGLLDYATAEADCE